MTEIRFGTDGWRALIAEDFTFDNLRAVAQATAEYMIRHNAASRGVVIGYDTRFLSGSFAGAVAEVMAGNDIHASMCTGFVPTPVLSHAVREREAGGGIMITASHNPARWNGFKIKLASGEPASATVTAEIEQSVPGVITGDRIRRVPLGEAEARGMVERFDARPAYLAAVRALVDIDAIRAAGLNVLVDSMYGAAAGWTADAVGE